MAGFYIEEDLDEIFGGDKNLFNFLQASLLVIMTMEREKNWVIIWNLEQQLKSYNLKNNNRWFSLGHISNANIGDKPGVEIISLSYQVPF